MTPDISVVMPCRNAADTLPDAIASIQAQSFDEWELIVFDDGSTDESAVIAALSAEKDPRIRVIVSSHVGIVQALRQACGEARGRLIARMDADDIALPERLAQQRALMDEEPAIALCGTRVEVFGPSASMGRRRYEAWLNGLITHDEIVRELFVECPLAHPTFMIRKDAYEEVGGYQEHGWAEDYDLCMRLFLAGKRFGKTAEVGLRWRDAPGRLSMEHERYSPRSFRDLKRHYLFEGYLKGRGRFHQWGAGEVGKQWLKEWGSLQPEEVVDINPRKIGRAIHGISVIAPEALPPPGATYIVIAVGAPGARDEIRAWLTPRGYVELRDFVFVA